MKNKAQEEYSDYEDSPKNIISNEQRIRLYRKAWLEGNLQINNDRLAQKLINFERQLEPALKNMEIFDKKQH